jgi:ubiquinone/menaquinone biosynthesis C-methylase UbiE
MQSIRFRDGDSYERGMSPWSRLAGEKFLHWLAPPTGLAWIDVGCGTGTFAALIAQEYAPIELHGIDPSEGQLAIARARPDTCGATFVRGDAMALPFEPQRFDAAVMALVIFFVPDPAKGIAEMVRVVRPGGWIAAYAWDVLGGGFPFDPIWTGIRAAGLTPLLPPNLHAGELEALAGLWRAAGLQAVETRQIVVERSFSSFEEYWAMNTITESVRSALVAMSVEQQEALKARLRAQLPADPTGRVTWCARANAVKGRVGRNGVSYWPS